MFDYCLKELFSRPISEHRAAASTTAGLALRASPTNCRAAPSCPTAASALVADKWGRH